MSLVELDVQIEPAELPASVAALLDEAALRIDEFEARRPDKPVPGFVPSDFPLVYQTLRTMRRVHLPTGDRFCEWGSGFGVVAILAEILGFEAYGIEINEDLFRGARQLAEDFTCDVQFVNASYIPDSGEVLADQFGDLHWLDTTGASGYDELDLAPDDFDVIFAYPWPGEEDVIFQLFDHFAARGALLLTYHGVEQIRLRRKLHSRRSGVV